MVQWICIGVVFFLCVWNFILYFLYSRIFARHITALLEDYFSVEVKKRQGNNAIESYPPSFDKPVHTYDEWSKIQEDIEEEKEKSVDKSWVNKRDWRR